MKASLPWEWKLSMKALQKLKQLLALRAADRDTLRLLESRGSS